MATSTPKFDEPGDPYFPPAAENPNADDVPPLLLVAPPAPITML